MSADPEPSRLAVGGGAGASGRPPALGDTTGQPANVLARDPAATGTVDQLRHNELIPIHRSLGRMCQIDKPRWRRRFDAGKLWGAGAMLLIGGAVGAVLGIFPFLAAHPSHVAEREYIAGVCVAFVLGVLCALARMTRDEMKIDSAYTVYQMVDDIVKSYDAAISNTTIANPESSKQ